MNDTVKKWLVQVGGRFLGGMFAGLATIGTYIGANFSTINWKHSLISLGLSILVGGLSGCATFLKKNPLPWVTINPE